MTDRPEVERTREELADALDLLKFGSTAKAWVALDAAARSLREMDRYDPWENDGRCGDDSPEHGGVCQLPTGHTCDHVWFGDAGKFSSNPFVSSESITGRSDRWPLHPQEPNDG